LLFDAHATEWASPYGLVGLLAAGQAVRGPGGGSGGTGERPLLTAPTHAEVLTYWTRAGFFREAAELFEIHGKVPRVKAAEESDVLLPVTPGRADPGREPVPRSGPRSGPRRDPPLSRPLGRQDRDPQRDGSHRDRAQVGRRRTLEGRPPGVSGCPGAHHHTRAGVHEAVIQHI